MPTEKQYKVLLIDDSAEDRAMYCRYLQRGSSRAYQILEADSAAVGLDLYQRSLPDAILLDYLLPDMNGLDFLAVLQQAETQHVPVLMLTGQGNETIAVQALKSGAQDYLIKGNLTAVGLCRALEHAIEQFQLQQRLQQQQQQQQMINAIALGIRQSIQLEEILKTTVTKVQQFLKTDRVLVYKFQPDMGGTIVTESVLPGWSLILGSQIQDTCFQRNAGGDYRTGKSWAINNIYQANLTPCHRRLLEQFEVKANLVAPILVRGKLWGLLVAHQCSDFRQWQSSELDLLEALVVQIAIAIQQATAYQQVQDELAERKRIEAILRKSEQRYATLAEVAPVGIFQTDAAGHCLYTNERWCQIAGLTPAEAAGFGWMNGIHPDDRDLVSAEWYASVQENRPFLMEYRFQNAAGQSTWVLGQATAERDADEIVGYVGTVTDISDRKQAELMLQAANQQITTVWDSMTDAYITVDHEWRLIYANQAATQIISHLTNLAPEEILGKSHWELFPSLVGQAVEQEYQRAVTERVAVHLEVFYEPTANWFEAHAYPSAVGLGIYFRDISDRKQAETERLQAEQVRNELKLLENILDVVLAGYWDWDISNNQEYLSPGFKRMFGYENDELPNSPETRQRLIFADDLPSVLDCFDRHVQSHGAVPFYNEVRYRHKDGSTVWVICSGQVIEWDSAGKPLRMIGCHIDISDRKQGEQTLNQYAREVEDLYNNAPCGYHSLDGEGRIVNINNTELQWLGYTHAELLGESFAAIITDESLQLFQQQYPEFKRREWVQDLEIDLVCKDGSVFPVFVSATAVKDAEGTYLYSRTTLFDARDRKQFEASLMRYERIISSTKDGIALLDHHYTYQVANQEYLTWCNKFQDEVIGHSVRDVLGSELFDNFIRPRLDQCLAGQTVQYEKWFDSPNVVPQFLSVTYTPYLDVNQTVAGMIVSLRDITDRRQAEEQLQKSDAHLKTAQRIAQLGSWELDLRTGQITWSEEVFRIFGRDPAVGTPNFEELQQMIHLDDRDAHQQVVQTTIETAQPYEIEFRFYRPDSTLKYTYARGEPIADATGQIIQLVGTVLDITDRKQAEKDLQESEEFNRRMLESSSDCIKLVDLDGRLQYMNAGGQCIMEIDDFSSCINADWVSFWPEAVRSDLETAILSAKSGQMGKFQGFCPTAKGTPKWWDVVVTPILDEAGQVAQVLSVSRDITDRKQAEEQLRNLTDRLTVAVKSGAIAIWDWNVSENILTWDDRMCELYGITPNQFTNTYEDWISRLHPDDRPHAEAAIQKALAGEKEYDPEFRVVHSDGTIHFIKAYALVQRNAQGETQSMVGINFDITDRKQVEQELTRNRDLREAIFNESADALFLVDPDTFLILDCNQRAVDLFGVGNKAELIGIQGNTLHRHQFSDQELADIVSEMQAKGFWDREIEYVTRQGNFFWGSIAAKPIAVAERTMNLVRVTDISDRKRAGDALRDSERRFATLSEAAPVALFRFDITGSCIYVNDRWSEMTGRSVEEGLGWGWTKTIHPQDYEWISVEMAEWLQTCKAGDLYRSEARTLRADGSIIWYFCQMLPETDASGTKLGYIGTLTDITDRKQAEEELRSLSDRLALAVKSGAIAIWDWNVSENILTWDDRMYELYGITPNQFTSVYDAWANSLHPDDRPLTEAAIQQALAGEKDYDPEFRVVHPDGTIHFLKAAALVQRNPQGEPQYMVGINFDITERKQAEIELMKTTAQLEASNKELEAFAYSVSHDLRSPLRAIDGFSRALLEDYGDQFGEEGKDYFDRIRHNVGRMGTLIDDLLNLSRVSRSEMQYSAVNLSTLVQEQLHELQALEPERQVIVVVAPEAIVSADATLMRVVISNLLQNAWKFTSHHATAHIEFGIMQREGESIYFIRDDGAGFDMAYAKMLFGVFQRLHNTHEFPGTGIGLATVQRAIHRHGGRVWAEGTVEQGATLYFTVPHSPLQTGA